LLNGTLRYKSWGSVQLGYPLSLTITCADKFSDLSIYKPQAKDKSVIAWPLEHTKPDAKHKSREISFRIEAQYLEETDHGRAWREMWEKAHRQHARQERKNKRKEKEAMRSQLGHDTHIRDEL